MILLLLLVKREILRLPSLISLGSLNRRHQGIRDRRLVGSASLGRGQSVERDAEGELEGFELNPGGVGVVARPRACLAQGGVWEGEEGGDHVERRRMGVSAAARHGHRLVEDGGGVLSEALPGGGYRRRHVCKQDNMAIEWRT